MTVYIVDYDSMGMIGDKYKPVIYLTETSYSYMSEYTVSNIGKSKKPFILSTIAGYLREYYGNCEIIVVDNKMTYNTVVNVLKETDNYNIRVKSDKIYKLFIGLSLNDAGNDIKKLSENQQKAIHDYCIETLPLFMNDQCVNTGWWVNGLYAKVPLNNMRVLTKKKRSNLVHCLYNTILETVYKKEQEVQA